MKPSTITIFNCLGIYMGFMKTEGKTGGHFIRGRNRLDVMNRLIAIKFLSIV